MNYNSNSKGDSDPEIDPCLGVAKKRSAGAVQQRRCGLIDAFDVIHVVKEERQLELLQLDGSGGVEDELESGGTRFVVFIMNNIKEH